MNRADRVRQVTFLRERGLTRRQAAEALGLSRGGLSAIINDPTGDKQRRRRERYRGTCEVCGTKTDGSSGYNAPRLCASCSRHAKKVWTREAIISAIKAWAAVNGYPPTATEWRRAGPGHPSAQSVYGANGVFRFWADAIEEAGFPRPRVGGYDRSRPHVLRI